MRNPSEQKPDPARLIKLAGKGQRWLAVINADPDAMASALALRRILWRKAVCVDIAKVNAVKRPDNLAMISLLHIKMLEFTPDLAASYDKLALLDSQPHHHELFKDFKFDVIIDHHPRLPQYPLCADYLDVREGYGATSSIFTEYLKRLKIRPAKLLATALVYGIKTDTQSFERPFIDADVRAFSHLTRFHSRLILRKITSSEFNRSWLGYFSKAFNELVFVGRQGLYLDMAEVESPDILVILADFFTRVHGLSWNLVSGIYADKAVIILRGDGLKLDMGELARSLFGELGSAGGHKAMARAEFCVQKLEQGRLKEFILARLVAAGFIKGK